MTIQVTGLRKRFTAGDLPAVEDVSFTAAAGTITSLLGPSGSGKTTVLRMIAGLEEPDAGVVRIEGADCTHVPVQKRGVGFVFQGYALFEHLDVRGNVGFGLKIQKAAKSVIDDRVAELLALVGLKDFGQRLPSQLSGGQRQRVAFARALATRPRVLLLDEPFGALDTRVRLELREWLRELNAKTHVTTLLVTHDQEEALELSQQVVVMNQGKVAQAGAPNDVYDHPASPFIASFIGNANVLAGAAAGEQTFVRPNEVKLSKPQGDAAGVSTGKIEAIQRVGGNVRITLRLPSDERMSVQLRLAELEALGVAEGDRVLIDIGSAKVFMGDYAI